MIPPSRYAEIRRLFFAEHWPLNTIATQLGVHHDTVRRAVEGERFIRPGTQVRPSALDPYKAFILATLEQYPRLRATRLWGMVRERGYPGSAKQVERYVRTVRPAARAEAYLRLDTLAGEQAQVDWGNFGPLRVGSTTRLLSCFVFVLSWSRACYARFALDQTLESFLRGHVEAFAALQGVPRTILYDNLKSVVLERVGDHIRFHPRLLELAGHYHYAPQPCAVARGNEKGRVERLIQFLRHAFFAARAFRSVADLNAQLTRWIAEVAHARPVPGRREQRVAEALAEEQPRLLPLPAHPFPCDLLRGVCQRPPHTEPPGSGKLSHPGSPKLSQAGSPMVSHSGAAIVSHPAGRDRISFVNHERPCVAFGSPLPEVPHGGTEESGDRHPRADSPHAVRRGRPAHRP
jgi:transposase